MIISPEKLQEIADSILLILKQSTLAEAKEILQMNDYHGFLKARIPSDFLQKILSPLQLTEDDVQIEIVKVDTDLSDEIHYHEGSYAYVACLGQEYHTDNPLKAKAFLEDKWFSVGAGDIVKIPPKTPHGFTVEDGGVLIFLSVQAPPIEKDGEDDYHKVALGA